MKKILMIINGLNPGGAETFLLNTVKFLKKKTDFQVTVINLKKQNLLTSEFNKNKIKLIEFGFSRINFIIPLIRFIKFCISNKYEIIHSHLFISEFFGFIYKIFNPKTKFIITKYETGYWMKPGHILIEKIIKKFYNYVIVDNPIIKKILINKRNYNTEIDIVYPISFSFKETDNIPEFINKKYFNIIMPARFEKIKNHKILIKTAELLKKNITDFRFILLGDGEQKKHIQDLIYKNNLDECFILPGFVKDIYNYYQNCDLFILPSLNETSPVTLFESMLYKIPVIISDIQPINQIIKNNITGILINPEKPEQICESILKIYNNPNFKNKLIENGFKKFNTEFSCETQLNKLKKIYEKI
jgi:glycosyltransferase involved in cell wall biosynthesis